MDRRAARARGMEGRLAHKACRGRPREDAECSGACGVMVAKHKKLKGMWRKEDHGGRRSAVAAEQRNLPGSGRTSGCCSSGGIVCVATGIAASCAAAEIVATCCINLRQRRLPEPDLNRSFSTGSDQGLPCTQHRCEFPIQSNLEIPTDS